MRVLLALLALIILGVVVGCSQPESTTEQPKVDMEKTEGGSQAGGSLRMNPNYNKSGN